MEASAIIECFDIVEDSGGGRTSGSERLRFRNEFRFERGEDAFRISVVVAVALGTHALFETVSCEHLPCG